MEVNSKKFFTLAFMVLFVISSVLCCCFTTVVSAKEIAQKNSCHQTTDNKKTSHNTQDCACDQSLTSIETNLNIIPNDFSRIVIAALKTSLHYQPLKDSYSLSYTLLPQFYDTLPLYIKYSVLRI